MYRLDTGVPQDHAEAARWFRLAADQGDANGQGNLGSMCADGTGVPQDHAEAVRWYRLAADQGHAPAQGNLGTMYNNCTEVPQDHARRPGCTGSPPTSGTSRRSTTSE